MVYDLQQDNKKSKYYYREALKIDAGLSVAANNLAWNLCEAGGNLDEALKLAQQAREKMPDNPNVADILGWIYFKRAPHRSAVELLEECVKKELGSAVVHYHLGMSYNKNGDLQNAKGFLNRSLRLDPNLLQTMEIRSIPSKI